jgi:ribosomal protein S18 acetylase RimI-like enzyme
MEVRNSNSLSLRKATIHDAPMIIALCRKEREKIYVTTNTTAQAVDEYSPQLSQEIQSYIDRFGTHPHLHRWVAEIKDRIVGYLVYSINESDVVQIHGIYVDGEFHGKGIGSNLIKHVIDRYAGKLCKLRVVESNTRAMKFYEKLGFRPTGRQLPFRGDQLKIELQLLLPKFIT